MRETTFSSYFLTSTSPQPSLRIGLLLDGPELTRAAAMVVEDILASNFTQIELLLLRPVSGILPSARLRRTGLAWRTYEWFDRRRVRLSNDPLAPSPGDPLLAGIKTVRLGVEGGLSAPGTPPDVAEIQAAQLDVIVHLGLHSRGDPRPDLGIEPAIRSSAVYGVWAFRHGDPGDYRDGPVYAREMVANRPVCTVVLERLATGETPETNLAIASFPTDTGSWVRNQVQPVFGSTHLVIQKLHELHSLGWDRVARRSIASTAPTGQRSITGTPTAGELVRWIAPRLLRRLSAALQALALRRTQRWEWRMAIRSGRPGPTTERLRDMTGFRWIAAPSGHVYADPFLAEYDGRTWLFFEDLAESAHRGVIACSEVLEGDRLGPTQVELTSPGHLSYPYVFQDGGVPYMVPESASQRSVGLYRSTAFPTGWELDTQLHGEAAVDTTVWQQDGRWWFFTTIREPRGQAMALMLFFADSLRGAWVSHPSNPISMDIRKARGAGSIFTEDGRLFRPSQDGSRTYGYAVGLQEILVLSTTEYEERQVSTVLPTWHKGMAGTHTYNRRGAIEVTDGKFPITRSRSHVDG